MTTTARISKLQPLYVAAVVLVVLPFAMRYLLGLFPDVAELQIRIVSYVAFVVAILYWTGLLFELPVVTLILARLRLATPPQLWSSWPSPPWG